jgi:plasmid stabilization system protein ParE
MAFRVEITENAERDGENILDWLIAQHAGDTGLRWFQGLKDAIATLSEMRERCPLAPENKNFAFEVRHLLYGRKPHVHRILYTIEGDTAFILHIRHGLRQPLKG